jgi:hypothetical protein
MHCHVVPLLIRSHACVATLQDTAIFLCVSRSSYLDIRFTRYVLFMSAEGDVHAKDKATHKKLSNVPVRESVG